MIKPSDGVEASSTQNFLMNKYFSTIITLVFAYGLCLAGYMNIWPLFGAANQLLSALVLIALAVFLKMTDRKGWMLYVPMTFMFIVTMTALVMSVYGGITKLMAGKFLIGVDGLQLVLAIALMTLAILVVKHCGSELFGKKAEELESLMSFEFFCCFENPLSHRKRSYGITHAAALFLRSDNFCIMERRWRTEKMEKQF